MATTRLTSPPRSRSRPHHPASSARRAPRCAPRATLALILILVPTLGLAGAARAQLRFEEVAAAAGIDFVHTNGASADKLLPETYGAGLAFLDLESDGDLDLYLINGGSVRAGRQGALNGLFRNDGPGARRFVRLPEAAGAPGVGYGMGALAGDYDGDGDTDLHCTELGPDRLYANDGSGAFTDVTFTEGLGATDWGTSAVYLDADLDGDLDLFVVDYVQFSLERTPWCGRRDLGLRFYCDPRQYGSTTDRLYRNEGAGPGPRFTDVSAASGITARGNGLGALAADLDVDGDTDLYVANDMTPNFLYTNDGTGHFTDGALLLGAALSGDGLAQAGMGVDTGDYDGDGDPDLVVTNYQLEQNAIYRNDGDWWTDVSFPMGVGQVSLNYLGFGAGFFDVDNDGHLDLFVTNGHVHDNIEAFDPIVTHAQRAQVFRNEGGQFREITDELGPGLARAYVGRGSAFGDYDGDGDVDVAINCNGGAAALLRNEGGRHRSLRVRLVGAGGNRVGVGASVTVVAAGQRLRRWVKAGSGYLSTSEPTLHFGLGEATAADSVVVRWPDGTAQVRIGVAAGELTLRRDGAP